MRLRDLDPKERYDSNWDDVLGGFYIPALSRSVQYDRIGGLLSPATLDVATAGMAGLLQNGGRMRLITWIRIPRADQEAVREGLTGIEAVVERIVLASMDPEGRLQSDRSAALAWMIKEGSLEVRMAALRHDPAASSNDDVNADSVYHQKTGVLRDPGGDAVSFGGSINETGRPWAGNVVEELRVFCSWRPGQGPYVAADAERFERYWNGRAPDAEMFYLPAATRHSIARTAPATRDDAIRLLLAGTAGPQ